MFNDDSMFWRQRVDKEQRSKERFTATRALQTMKNSGEWADRAIDSSSVAIHPSLPTSSVRTATLPSSVQTQRASPRAGQMVQGWWYVDNSTNPPMYTLCTPNAPVVLYPADQAPKSPGRSRPSSQQQHLGVSPSRQGQNGSRPSTRQADDLNVRAHRRTSKSNSPANKNPASPLPWNQSPVPSPSHGSRFNEWQ